ETVVPRSHSSGTSCATRSAALSGPTEDAARTTPRPAARHPPLGPETCRGERRTVAQSLVLQGYDPAEDLREAVPAPHGPGVPQASPGDRSKDRYVDAYQSCREAPSVCADDRSRVASSSAKVR